ncbi:unnamed protein product [Arctia plantaginis]|uniref:Chitin-binding type-2 domain-containing protein n=1 Tax=Arctia plantaginis TaxID=874455 RepID=A0A8S1BXE9_ARCPL|nr:unnamed protein product [Arctia plantaginis]
MGSHIFFLLLYIIAVAADTCDNRQKTAFPHEDDCEKYYYCRRGTLVGGKCPPGLIFDIEKNACRDSSLAKCNRRKIPSVPLCVTYPSTTETPWPVCNDTSKIELLPDVEDCQYYYICIWGDRVHRKCLNDWYFSFSKLICLPEYKADCAEPTTTFAPTVFTTSTTKEISPTTALTTTNTEETAPKTVFTTTTTEETAPTTVFTTTTTEETPPTTVFITRTTEDISPTTVFITTSTEEPAPTTVFTTLTKEEIASTTVFTTTTTEETAPTTVFTTTTTEETPPTTVFITRTTEDISPTTVFTTTTTEDISPTTVFTTTTTEETAPTTVFTTTTTEETPPTTVFITRTTEDISPTTVFTTTTTEETPPTTVFITRTTEDISPTTVFTTTTTEDISPTTVFTTTTTEETAPTTVFTTTTTEETPPTTVFITRTTEDISPTTVFTTITTEDISPTTVFTTETIEETTPTTVFITTTAEDISPTTVFTTTTTEEIAPTKVFTTTTTEETAPTTVFTTTITEETPPTTVFITRTTEDISPTTVFTTATIEETTPTTVFITTTAEDIAPTTVFTTTSTEETAPTTVFITSTTEDISPTTVFTTTTTEEAPPTTVFITTSTEETAPTTIFITITTEDISPTTVFTTATIEETTPTTVFITTTAEDISPTTVFTTTTTEEIAPTTVFTTTTTEETPPTTVFTTTSTEETAPTTVFITSTTEDISPTIVFTTTTTEEISPTTVFTTTATEDISPTTVFTTTTTEETTPTTVFPTTPKDFLLCGRRDKWLKPDYTDCSYYYQCLNGYLYHQKCPPYFLFSPVFLRCRLGETVNCHVTTKDKTPVSDVIRNGCGNEPWLKPDTKDCRFYYQCKDGYINRKKCPENFLFSQASRTCVHKTEANCTYNTRFRKILDTAKSTTTAGEATETPTATAMSETKESSTTRTAGETTESSTTRTAGETTRTVGETTESSTTTTQQQELECSVEDLWIKPDPRNCSYYYFCVNGLLQHYMCSTFALFSPVELRCVDKNAAGCLVNSTEEFTTITYTNTVIKSSSTTSSDSSTSIEGTIIVTTEANIHNTEGVPVTPSESIVSAGSVSVVPLESSTEGVPVIPTVSSASTGGVSVVTLESSTDGVPVIPTVSSASAGDVSVVILESSTEDVPVTPTVSITEGVPVPLIVSNARAEDVSVVTLQSSTEDVRVTPTVSSTEGDPVTPTVSSASAGGVSVTQSESVASEGGVSVNSLESSTSIEGIPVIPSASEIKTESDSIINKELVPRKEENDVTMESSTKTDENEKQSNRKKLSKTSGELEEECDIFSTWSKPDMTSCRRYFLCIYGEITHRQCPGDYEFNPIDLKCQPKQQAGCDIHVFTDLSKTVTPVQPQPTQPERYAHSWTEAQTTVIKCEDSSQTYRPDPDDCTKYYMCFYGTLYIKSCPEGLEFSKSQLMCLPPSQAKCNSICKANGIYFAANPTDNTKYYICFNKNSLPQKCPHNFVFDTTIMAKNYTRTNTSEIHKEDLLNVIENNNIKVEYKETNIIPNLSNKIVINPIADNSVIYSLNNSIDKDKWSKEDDSLELLIVPSADNEFLGDDNHDSENNTMPAKIVDFLTKPEKNNNPLIKLKEKIKGKNKSNVTRESLLVIPSIHNNKTNNYTTANIDKEQKKNEILANRQMKKDLINVTEKLNTETTNTVNIKTTVVLPIHENTILIKVNRTNTNDSLPEGNISKNVSNNLITIMTSNSMVDKKRNIVLKSDEKEKDDIDGEITVQNSAVNKRVSKQETNTKYEIEESGLMSEDQVMQESKSYELSSSGSLPHRQAKRELGKKLPLPSFVGLLEPFNKKAPSKPKASRDFSDLMDLEPIILDNKF